MTYLWDVMKCNIYEKEMVECTFIKILNKKEQNMIIRCVYKHPKHGISG